MAKTKIVLDADVIIHFAKVDKLYFLMEIFPEYDYIVLSNVYSEIKYPTKTYLDNCVLRLNKIKIEPFNPTGEMYREYALLSAKLGKGESACLSYCRYTNNVIGSSNITDIKNYCEENKIAYLTTIDFLYYAIMRKKITIQEAEEFVFEVIKKGSILPDNIDFESYVPTTQM